MKQKTFTFYCCIVGTCFGGVQKAFVKLYCCFCNCSCYCGDLSHCCSCCCSHCGKGLKAYDVIQTGVAVIVCLKSSRCCTHWDKCLLEMCRAVVWDRKLLERRVVIFWDRMLLCRAFIIVTGCCFAGLSSGSCKKLDVVIVGLLSGSSKKLEVVIAGPLFVNRIILLGVFGLQKGTSERMHCNLWNRVVLQRAGAACAQMHQIEKIHLVPPRAHAYIDWVHQPTRAKKMVGQILHSHGKQLLPPLFTVPDVRIGCVER
jgi:hypothetical protein